ncbi:hypothetical protein DNTS_004830 [Danionella cerebrum]|uniref:BUD13 homolog n=1 Tax=Danionella cerebrum TaxID=2873325 RepID=A0A553RBT9_9TELE|nr:hypothetical protein DNTS_004830 [Danionella translucida]
MAASTSLSKGTALTKADYLKRYLSTDDGKKSKEKKIKKKRPKPMGKGMKIVDDDIDWRQLAAQDEEQHKEEEEEEDEAPVIADVIDERPDEIKQFEAFRTSKWKVMGATDEDPDNQESTLNESQDITGSRVRHDSPEGSPVRAGRHDSPDLSPKRNRHDSPGLSPPKRARHDSPDLSPPRRGRHDSPAPSSARQKTQNSSRHDSSSPSPPRKGQNSSPSRNQRQPNKESPVRKKTKVTSSPSRRRIQRAKGSDSDQSPPRRRPHGRQGSDSDLSPPRKRGHGRRGSDSDLSPPRKKTQERCGSDSDLSPPRRMKASDGQTVKASRNAETIFRDKSGRTRDLNSERADLSRKAEEKAEKDEKYAQWGKGLAQGEMQQQNVIDAVREAQKPLARHIDDEDLDRMLREQEREGDPMAAMLRKKKDKTAKLKGIKEKPRYKGPTPPPNRFNIMPGYRWDGVDRSNGFEQKRYSRIADNKAVQEMAYKWSVEDM